MLTKIVVSRFAYVQSNIVTKCLLLPQTISVEWNRIPEGKESLIQLMASKGYLYYMLYNRNLTHDLIFVKRGLLTDQQLANVDLPIINDVFYEKIYEM